MAGHCLRCVPLDWPQAAATPSEPQTAGAVRKRAHPQTETARQRKDAPNRGQLDEALPRHELLVMGPATWWRKRVPLKLPLPLSLVLFPRGVLAGVLVFLPRQACWQTRRCWLRSASTEDDRPARITRRGRRNAGKALASRPPGSPCSYVTPAQARPMGSTSHTHEGRGDRCGRGGYDGQTGRWRRPGIDGKHRRCCRAGEAAAGLIRRSVW